MSDEKMPKLTDAEWQETLTAALASIGDGEIQNNRCVCCGAVVPEGRMVCAECENTEDGKLTRRAAEMADALRRCMDDDESCCTCAYNKPNCIDARCIRELMADTEKLLRAILLRGE